MIQQEDELDALYRDFKPQAAPSGDTELDALYQDFGPPSVMDRVKSFGASVGAGALESTGVGLEGLQSAADWIGSVTGLESGGGFHQAATPMRRLGREAAQYAAEAAPDQGMVNQAGQAIGSGVPLALGALATGGVAWLAGAGAGGADLVGTTAVGIGGAAMQGQSDYEQAVQGGAGPDAARAAGLLGAVIGTSEAWPVWGVVGSIVNRTGMNPERVTHILTKAILENAVQEGAQQLGSNLGAIALYDNERAVLDGVAKSMALGAAAGGAGAGAVLTGAHVVDKLAGPGTDSARPEPVQGDPLDVRIPPESGAAAQNVPQGAKGASAAAAPKSKPSPPPIPLSDLTGIKNAAVDAEREALGLGPATHGERSKWEDRIADARTALEKDPEAGKRLVDELAATPRNIDDSEGALLLAEMVRIKNERTAARTALDEAMKSGKGIEDAHKRVEAATSAYFKAGEAATLVGTKQGQSLAFRRAMLKADYSLAEMERAVQDANGGEPLTAADRAEVQALHDKIAELETKNTELTKRASEAESKQAAVGVLPAIRMRARRNKGAQVSGPVREGIAARAAESRKALKGMAFGGIPVDAIPHLVNIGAEYVARGVTEFKAWSEAIVAEVGERVRPHLDELFEKAKTAVRDARVEYLAGRVKERIGAGKDMGQYASKIAEHFIKEGIDTKEEGPLVDAVHEVLKKVDPEITWNQTRDAISGHGKYRPPTEDAVKRKLIDIKHRLQKLAQIDSLLKKIAPPKTGFGRPEPSARERELTKQVNDLKKETGITSADPEKALKTALQSRETSLRNRIEDLQHEIDTGKRVVDVPGLPPTSPTIEALQKELDALRAQHAEVFGKPGVSDEKKAEAAIKAAERSIADNERRIREGDVGPKPKMQGPGTQAVEALRRKREALVARNDALRAEIAEMRDAGKPKRTPDQIALASAKARELRKKSELLDRIERGDFDTKPRKPLVPDAELLAVKGERQQVEARYQRLKKKKAWENRTKKQKALDAGRELFKLPTALTTAYDVSAPGRQGFLLAVSDLAFNPKRFARHIRLMFKALASEEAAHRIDAEMRSAPDFDFWKSVGLQVTDLDHELGPQEEAIHSNLSDRIPGVRPSNRAFITFLNIQRIEAARDILRGISPENGTPTLEDGRSIARMVNHFTGRGGWKESDLIPEARWVASATRESGLLIWSPKLLLSRFQVLFGESIIRSTPAARRVIMKQFAKSFIATSAMLGLLALAGYEIGTDPESPNWMKVKVGDTTIDPLAGLSQDVVLLSRLMFGEKTTFKGKRVPLDGKGFNDDRMGVVMKFLRSKLGPVPGAVVDVLKGKNYKGDEVTPGTIAAGFAPMSPVGFYQALVHEGVPRGTALGILSMLGVGVKTNDD